MLIDKLSDGIRASFTGFALVAVIVLVVCFVPAIFVWAVNGLAEAGGSSFHLEHGLFNYLLVLVFVAIVRGGK